jgi:hypothetical protein
LFAKILHGPGENFRPMSHLVLPSRLVSGTISKGDDDDRENEPLREAFFPG